MKLRNKKTGEIGELHFEPDKEYHFTIVTEDPSDVMIYKTLGEVIKDWEDFVDHVPLIEDPKIRKAVRAWAELVPPSKLSYDHVDRRLYTKSDYLIWQTTYSISFPVELDLSGTRDYTITELCGEEEECER